MLMMGLGGPKPASCKEGRPPRRITMLWRLALLPGSLERVPRDGDDDGDDDGDEDDDDDDGDDDNDDDDDDDGYDDIC